MQTNIVPVNQTSISRYFWYDSREEPSDSSRFSHTPDVELRINYDYGTNKYVGKVNRDTVGYRGKFRPGVSINNIVRTDSLRRKYVPGPTLIKYIENNGLQGVVDPDSVRYAWTQTCVYNRRPVLAPYEKNKNFYNNTLGYLEDGAIAFVWKKGDLHGNTLTSQKDFLMLGDVSDSYKDHGCYNHLHELCNLLSPFDFSQYHERLILQSGFTSEKLKLIQFRYGTAVEIKGLSPEPDEWTYDGFIYRDPDKIAKILAKPSFEFHVTLPEMVNIQLARVFVLTTILTLILTLFLKMLRPYAMPLWNKFIGLSNWLLLTIILLLVVFIYLILFHPITINHFNG
ncbi:MAG: hypothetical protein K2H87_00560 [Duncaniella sp.]|nr:hypothetical protein [Duncaniella sp.]